MAPTPPALPSSLIVSGTTVLKSDPTVIGKTVRLGARSATIVGVLEPSVPYPAETEIIANVVTSPHHLSATMVTGRVHRMTELFGRLAPGATLESGSRRTARRIRSDGSSSIPKLTRQRPTSAFTPCCCATRSRPARGPSCWCCWRPPSGLCHRVSNVANLILARTVRREGELAIRAALGASTGALRRTLLAESLLLCGAGARARRAQRPADGCDPGPLRLAILGARARSDSRFQHALGRRVLAVVAAMLLAFVPRLAFCRRRNGFGLASGSLRITGSTNRRLRIFAVTQIAASFMLLAGAGMLLKTLLALQAATTGFDMRRRAGHKCPVMSYGKTSEQIINFYKEAMRRIERTARRGSRRHGHRRAVA